ncbi:peptide deformylase [Lentimicrobium sp.]|uniref:peptide deformylase n=2 Tax=Lentimicrobium sp. TaxID=2034841 RepID=UPI0025D9E918|nr:peptide deformylase [Lentimicrobium sp.]MCO5257986.1 peptide deformylase [Lentimicrobium sp.]MCO5262086.1 peptide deformylase [Lentimicrobium sp.]HPF63582.1 peptide deformylase [Lentimicrobium sp.]HPJ62298.1 peptide deformylase [Lentimicrobium sp.]HPR25502.1 peptide deformylase [Lentimicrobium sp.]
MIMPIVAYGHPTLRKKAEVIDKDYPDLQQFIADMFETMYASNGVGLAAPQVNRSIRLFVIDATPYAEDFPGETNLKRVFINPRVVEERGEEWSFNEGCLSIPDIREDVLRKTELRIQYYDEQFNYHDEVISGVLARVMQHEYDHLEGVLFVDRINPLRKIMLKRKLTDITKGLVKTDYRMIFPLAKKR